MRLLRELGLLGSETITVWLHAFTRMTFWCALGLVSSSTGLFISAALGGTSELWSMLVFIVGVLGMAVCSIMMLYSAHDVLQSPRQLRRTPRTGVPETVFTQNSSATLLNAVGPFLVVYSLWGLVEDEIQQLFSVNLMLNGLETEQWSIGFNRWQFHVTLAASVFLIKQVIQSVAGRVRTGLLRRILDVITMLCEATWIFAFFIVVNNVVGRALPWLMRRHAWVELSDRWYSFLAALPTIELPFGRTLNGLLHEFWPFLAEQFLPGMANYIALPIFWLALTAVVHGWRDFSVRSVISGRTGERLAHTEHGLLALATRDLREKYLPVISCVRLLLRGGPHFLAAYLIAFAVLALAEESLHHSALLMTGVSEEAMAIAIAPVIEDVAVLLTQPLMFALYLAAFDRAIADTTGVDWEHRRILRATTSSATTSPVQLTATPHQVGAEGPRPAP